MTTLLVVLGYAAIVGAILSVIWYPLRAAIWPGRETARLPLWARVVQAVIEALPNLPGAVRAVVGSSGPPGAPPEERPTMASPPPGAP